MVNSNIKQELQEIYDELNSLRRKLGLAILEPMEDDSDWEDPWAEDNDELPWDE